MARESGDGGSARRRAEEGQSELASQSDQAMQRGASAWLGAGGGSGYPTGGLVGVVTGERYQGIPERSGDVPGPVKGLPQADPDRPTLGAKDPQGGGSQFDKGTKLADKTGDPKGKR